jgi:AraC-like DNA-binding protein
LPILGAEIANMPKKESSVLNLNSFNKKKEQPPDFYIKTFQEHKAEHPFVMRPHSHDFYLIMIFTKGSGVHQLDFNTYNIHPGSIFFMSPGQMHSWTLSDDADGHVLFFNSSFYSMDREERRITTFPFYNAAQLSAVKLSLSQLTIIYPYISLLQSESHIGSPFQHFIVRSILDSLLYKLFSFFPTHQIPSTDISLITRIELLIEQFYKEHLPASAYAEKLNITTQKMNQHTRQFLNKTLTELVNERLMIEAKRLLAYSDKSVSEIAYEMNFNDNSYFNKFFKRMESETPEQFRKRFI